MNKSNLVSKLYHPKILQAAVMIAPATGIKKEFYHAFASFLCENGFGVITYDNIGIGESAGKGVKYSNASLVSWGTEDMSTIFSQLKATFPNVPYHLVGHSAGGQLVGLMQGADELSSIFNIACSSGSIRNMQLPFRIKAKFFMSVFIPLCNQLMGYTPSQWVGMGEPLPKQVAQQWADWCNSTGYIKDYLDTTDQPHSYWDLEIPAFWLNATDDDIANNTNVADMIRVFPKLKNTVKTLEPANHDLKEIGHMKFFSRKHRNLWSLALDWLEKHT